MPAFAISLSRFLIGLCVACLLSAMVGGPAAAQKIKIEAYPDLDAPYVKTPHAVVDAMLRLARTTADDIHYDLGSGDGRIVIAAARDFGVKKAVGVDLNPERVAEARAKARIAGVADRVRFVHGDVFKFDFTEATVLTMYLLPEVNLKLRPRVLALKPGTRVVSHDFSMGRWKPEKHVKIGTQDIYLWIVPAKAAGRWTLGTYTLELTQKFQQVSGVLRTASAQAPIGDAVLRGTRLQFSTRVGDRALRFDGEVRGETIIGTLNGTAVTAKRITE